MLFIYLPSWKYLDIKEENKGKGARRVGKEVKNNLTKKEIFVERLQGS
jgi:hypothetical protein